MFFICKWLWVKKKVVFLQPHSLRREHSSAGSEHLPYKQGVTSSNLVVPTTSGRRTVCLFFILILLFALICFSSPPKH